MKLNIANDYSSFTGLRHSVNSDLSGEDFYHKKLNPIFAEAYKKDEILELVLDGSLDGYAPSFLDEAIGNLIYDFGADIVRKILTITSERESQWPEMIYNETYPKWSERRSKGQEPKITVEHEPWYRVVNGELLINKWNTIK
jgi:hypothetical protein